MEIKVKITYFDIFGGSNQIMAKIIRLYGWYDLANQLSNNQISEQSILKIELIPEANDFNVVDTTN